MTDKRPCLVTWTAFRENGQSIYGGSLVVADAGRLKAALAFYADGHPCVGSISVQVFPLGNGRKVALRCDASAGRRAGWEKRRHELQRASAAEDRDGLAALRELEEP